MVSPSRPHTSVGLFRRLSSVSGGRAAVFWLRETPPALRARRRSRIFSGEWKKQKRSLAGAFARQRCPFGFLCSHFFASAIFLPFTSLGSASHKLGSDDLSLIG